MWLLILNDYRWNAEFFEDVESQLIVDGNVFRVKGTEINQIGSVAVDDSTQCDAVFK